MFCLCTVALASCFFSQFARSAALLGTRRPRREPGWLRHRCRRLWYVRGWDCISKDPPFSPRHHHHSSAASPTAQDPAAAAAAASNLPLPPPPFPSPPLPRGAHPHIRGNLRPAPPTFKCTGRYKCIHSPRRDLSPYNERRCSLWARQPRQRKSRYLRGPPSRVFFVLKSKSHGEGNKDNKEPKFFPFQRSNLTGDGIHFIHYTHLRH